MVCNIVITIILAVNQEIASNTNVDELWWSLVVCDSAKTLCVVLDGGTE